MIVVIVMLAVVGEAVSPPAVRAQQSRAQAVQQGEDLGHAVQARARSGVENEDAPTLVPSYGGSDLPQNALGDDPEALTRQGVSAARSSGAVKVIIDPSRPRFDPAKIDVSRARMIASSPDTYLGGQSGLDGAKGQCQPLPASQGGSVGYFASCNIGTRVTATVQGCEVPLRARTVERPFYEYTCDAWPEERCPVFDPYIADGRCTVSSVKQKPVCLQGALNDCTEPELITSTTLACSEPVSGLAVPPQRTRPDVTTVLDDAACQAATAGQTCTLDAETCIDASPQTRIIDGLPVTRSCWKWQRAYSCASRSQANDCAALQSNPACAFDHEECLDDPQQGDCAVRDEVYRCTIGTGRTEAASVCGSDLYCIHGECTKIDREASSEFGDALAAVHAMGDVRDQFDPNDLSLFKGEATGCHRPIFGLVNCCAGKSSGLISASAGAAAIAGGPAAIAALATPLLTQYLCSSDEKLLDVKDRMGLCHDVGTYCSQKALFVCTTKRRAYCCFPSKLSRVLQEQGRAQLGLGWGSAKHPQCRGFTLAEFQKLDLGKMDFSEVYGDFAAAAKLPDEIAVSAQIQGQIREYYQLHSNPAPQ